MSDIKIYGEHEPKTLAQMQRCMTVGSAVKGVLCANGHLGYASKFCTRCGRSPSRWPGRESSTPTRTEGGVRATLTYCPRSSADESGRLLSGGSGLRFTPRAPQCSRNGWLAER